jgi:hypothetical protein
MKWSFERFSLHKLDARLLRSLNDVVIKLGAQTECASQEKVS